MVPCFLFTEDSMEFWEILVIAVGLSMDAFAVSICKGLAAGRATNRQALSAGLWFGGFQALMPTLGYFLGYRFRDIIESVDHWIAFFLLCYIGLDMIRGARKKENEDADFGWKKMFTMAVATSIDALATGVMFSFMEVDIVPTALSIGLITFGFSYCGIRLGARLGYSFKEKAQIAGGIVLIAMGFKILLEHLGVF